MNVSKEYFIRENSTAAYSGEWEADQYVGSLTLRKSLPDAETIVKEMHQRVLSPLLPAETRDRFAGVYRTGDFMGVSGSGLSCPHGYEVPREMRLYGQVMNAKLKQVKCDKVVDIASLIKSMGYGHYELVRIHPFVDGTGRVARKMLTLMSKLACKKPIIIAPKHRSEYLDLLEKVTVTDNVDYFNKFLAKRWIGSLSRNKSEDLSQINELENYVASLRIK